MYTIIKYILFTIVFIVLPSRFTPLSAQVYEGMERGCDCFDNKDNDSDGFIDNYWYCRNEICNSCFDNDQDGWYTCGGDCNDNNPEINPGAAEICDGIDNNCDGWTPPTDKDKDGDGVPMCMNDCNDSNNTVYPGAPELCDGLDNNCDYVIPLNEMDTDSDGNRTCGLPVTCPDADNDGFAASSCGGTDCNDINSKVYPGAPELCTDGKDNDCNGRIDETPCTCPDADNDGFTASSCGGADCDDNNADIFPLYLDICNELNNNCVDPVTLTWYSPTTNADGTSLLDLAGYNLYFGSSADYRYMVDLGNNTCQSIANLSLGWWCFAITAYDTSGNESAFSNEVCAYLD